MAVCARGSVLVFYAVFAGFFQLFGETKYRSGRFSGSGVDDHQLIFFIWPKLGKKWIHTRSSDPVK